MRACAAPLITEKIIHRIELAVFFACICLVNLPLFSGGYISDFSFVPARVGAGEWWRVLTHPFVHVSWYHLILDVSAFLLLYRGLLESSWMKRLFYVGFCAIGSLLVSMLSPAMADGGLCGLSGAAHGLMAVSALEVVTSTSAGVKLRRAGMIGLGVVVIKSMIEVITGEVVFAFMHIGDVGTPLTLSHAGGALAGILAFVAVRSK